MNKKNTTTEATEAAKFPPEFVDCLTETSIKTLSEHLKKIGASEDALRLLDSTYFLLKDGMSPSGEVKPVINEMLIENVSEASRCIASLGGVFYAPGGTSLPRPVL